MKKARIMGKRRALKKDVSFSVRMTEEELEKLRALELRTGVKLTNPVSVILLELLQHVEQRDGVCESFQILPLRELQDLRAAAAERQR